jgi:hypothetical protein
MTLKLLDFEEFLFIFGLTAKIKIKIMKKLAMHWKIRNDSRVTIWIINEELGTKGIVVDGLNRSEPSL